MSLPTFILASVFAPPGAELLRQLELEFTVIPGNASEVAHEFLSPMEVCQLNAHRKARAVAKKIPDALVLGADTLVFLDGEILGKPGDWAEAERMLLRLQGRTHQVVTGVSLIHLRTHRERLFAVNTDVRFYPLGAEMVPRLSGTNQSPWTKRAAMPFRSTAKKLSRKSTGPSAMWLVCRWNGCVKNWMPGRLRMRRSQTHRSQKPFDTN